MQRPWSVWILSLLVVYMAPPAHSAADPPSQEKAAGPGDRPSVCYQRALEYITPNLDQMTKIAELLLAEKAVDEAGLIRYRDGSTKLHMAYSRIPLERAGKLRARFAALFDGLIVNFFTPSAFREHDGYVSATPGLYDPDIFNINTGPWCGGTDEQWRGESEKTFTAGVILERGGPISYRYAPEGENLKNPCSDEVFLSDKIGECELRLNEHWAMAFFYHNMELEPSGE